MARELQRAARKGDAWANLRAAFLATGRDWQRVAVVGAELDSGDFLVSIGNKIGWCRCEEK